MSVKICEEQKIFAPFLGEPLSHIVGQDPLGLLNTGGKTFDLLLPGLNNVTDRIRYYSFYCWFFHSYAKHVGIASKKGQFDHLRRAEFILSLLAAKNGVQGIGGITKALELYDDSMLAFDLTIGTGEKQTKKDGTYWKNPRGIFGQNYVSSLKQLFLIADQDEKSECFIRTKFEDGEKVSGYQLATAFEENLGSEVANLFIEVMKKGIVSQEDLVVFSEPFYMLKIPLGTNEHQLIWQLITGNDEPKQEKVTLFRKRTIQLLLETIKLSDQQFFGYTLTFDAYHAKGKIEEKYDETFSLWYFYQLEQFWHMSCTGSLSVFLKILNDKSKGNWIDEEILLDEIVTEIINFFLNGNYISKDQTFKDLKIIDLEEEEIVEKVRKSNDNVEKLCFNILLIKKLIFNNENEIPQLFIRTNIYKLNSNSSFISSVASLLNSEDLSLNDFVKYFLKKYVIIRHQWVSLKKMNDTQSTEKFIRENGFIRFIDDVDYAYSSPRLNTLIDFMNELQLLNGDRNDLSATGINLFNSL